MPKLYTRIIKTILVSYLFINAIIWAFSPTLINLYLSELLSSQDLTINDKSSIRYNPFISQIHITDLSITLAQSQANEGKIISIPTATVEFSLFKLIAKNLVIEQFYVDGLEANVSLAITHFSSLQSELIVDDSLEPKPQIEDETSENNDLEETKTVNWFMPLTFEMPFFNITHSKVQFDLAGDKQVIDLNQLKFSEVLVSEESQSGEININLLFNGALFEFDSKLKLNKGIGELQYALDLQELNLSHLASAILKPLNSQYQTIDGLLSFKTEQNVAFNKEDISSQIQDINLVLSELSLTQQKLKTQGTNQTVSGLSFNIAKFAIVDGVIDVSLPHSLVNLLNTADQQPINVTDDLTLRSNLSLEQDDLLIKFVNESGLSSTELVNISKLSIPEIDVLLEKSQVQLQINMVELDNITAGNTQVTSNTDKSEIIANLPLLNILKLSVNDIKVSNNGLNIDGINITKVNAAITKQQNGKIAQLDPLLSVPRPTTAETEDVQTQQTESEIKSNIAKPNLSETESPFNLYIGKVSLEDKLSFSVVDRSVTPSYQNTIHINELSIEPIDNSIPEVTSKISVSGSLDTYSKFNIEAEIKPFNKEKYIKSDITVTEFDLSAITTYLKDIVAIESGHLNTITNFIINGNEIKGNAKLNLSRVELGESVEYDQASSIDTLIPVNVALSMLKDGDGNIELEVPVEGNLDDPSFRLSGFMSLLVQRATMSATKNYLINAFVPYANIIQIGMQAGDLILKVRFQDLILSVGEVELPKSADVFLKQFSALMLDKKSTQITVCAMSTKADIGVEHSAKLTNSQLDELNRLSLTRMKNFKNYMIDTHEIESARLLLCAPKIDVTESAKPRLIFTS